MIYTTSSSLRKQPQQIHTNIKVSEPLSNGVSPVLETDLAQSGFPELPFTKFMNRADHRALVQKFVDELDNDVKHNFVQQPVALYHDLPDPLQEYRPRNVDTDPKYQTQTPSRSRPSNDRAQSDGRKENSDVPAAHSRSSSSSTVSELFTLRDDPHTVPHGGTTSTHKNAAAASVQTALRGGHNTFSVVGPSAYRQSIDGDVQQRRDATNDFGGRHKFDDATDVQPTAKATKPLRNPENKPALPQKSPQRSRTPTAIRRRQQLSLEDNSLPSISDSVSETGVEMVDGVALSSDYENGVKIPEHEAASILRLPSPEPTMAADSFLLRQASPPPPIGSNQTRKIKPRSRTRERSDSAATAQTQIDDPLSAAFPAGSSYVNESRVVPRSNIVGPGSLPESVIERAPPENAVSDEAVMSTDDLYASIDRYNKSIRAVLNKMPSNGEDISIPTIQSAILEKPEPRSRKSVSERGVESPQVRQHAPKVRSRTSSLTSATNYSIPLKSASVAQRLNALQNTVAMPRFPDAYRVKDFDIRSASMDERANAGDADAYPPDIARGRGTRTVTIPQIQQAQISHPRPRQRVVENQNDRALVPESIPREHAAESNYGPGELHREDSGIGGFRSSLSSGETVRPEDMAKEKIKNKGGNKLLRKLRGLSMNSAA